MGRSGKGEVYLLRCEARHIREGPLGTLQAQHTSLYTSGLSWLNLLGCYHAQSETNTGCARLRRNDTGCARLRQNDTEGGMTKQTTKEIVAGAVTTSKTVWQNQAELHRVWQDDSEAERYS